MKNFLLTLLFVGGSLSSFSQGYVPPSPDAMGLAKFANTPVNYYTGTPSINIPLTQISGKELSVPISLSYNASGIKVQEVAGSVGLGWSLNAGGVITRIVRGLPDEQTYGYCGANHIGTKASNPDDTYYTNVGDRVWDGEPDLFYFNFLGRSGKFVLDAYGEAVVLPFQMLSIKPGICSSGDNSWMIIDENGVRYIFGKTSNERESTTHSKVTGGSSTTFISSWYLSEIQNPDETEKVSFNYISSTITNTNYSFKQVIFSSNNQICSQTVYDESTNQTISTKYISTISAPYGYVSFSWTGGRQDVAGGLSLSGLSTTSSTGETIGKFRFNYEYFQSDNCSSPLCKRLKLKNIFDKAPDPICTFYYNLNQNLPARDSKRIDHWGYYNNNAGDSWLPAYSDANVIFPGVSREPDATLTKANILNRIDFREGGYQEFEYESHQVWKDGANKVIGGVRISRIISGDPVTGTVIKDFKYCIESNPIQSSGLFYREPKYGYSISGTESNQIGQYITFVVAFRFSHSLTDIYDINGAYVGYSRVEEIVSGNGKTVYEFTNFNGHEDIPAIGNTSAPDSPPFVPYTSRFWERGNLFSVKNYSASNVLLSNISYSYSFNESNKKIIMATGAMVRYSVCYSVMKKVYYAQYQIISRPFTLVKQTTETYDPANNGKKMTTVTEYSYDPYTFLPTQTIQYDANRPSLKYINQTKYSTHADYDFVPSPGVDCNAQYQECQAICANEPDPQVKAYCYSDCDYQYSNCSDSPPTYASPEVAAIVSLKNRHQISTPVEMLSLIQDGTSVKVLNSNVNIYQVGGTSGTHVTLKESWNVKRPIDVSGFQSSKANADGTFSFDNRMRKITTNNSYDQTTSNLLQQTSFDGIVTNYTWDATNNFVISTTSTGDVNSRTTSSTVKPLVGTLTSTDANGRVTRQEYDAYNRPFITKDHDGNILSRTRYHYKNETPGFLLIAGKTEALVNEMLNFQVTDIAAAVGGTPTFSWDFGDGSVLTNNTLSVSHAYSKAGVYMLKAVGLNPEYDAAIRTLQITINNPMTLSVSKTPIGTTSCEGYSLTAVTNDGCSNKTYSWRYRNIAYPNYWYPLGTGNSTVDFYPGDGSFEIECSASDACGSTVTDTVSVVCSSSGGGPQPE